MTENINQRNIENAEKKRFTPNTGNTREMRKTTVVIQSIAADIYALRKKTILEIIFLTEMTKKIGSQMEILTYNLTL